MKDVVIPIKRTIDECTEMLNRDYPDIFIDLLKDFIVDSLRMGFITPSEAINCIEKLISTIECVMITISGEERSTYCVEAVFNHLFIAKGEDINDFLLTVYKAIFAVISDAYLYKPRQKALANIAIANVADLLLNYRKHRNIKSEYREFLFNDVIKYGSTDKDRMNFLTQLFHQLCCSLSIDYISFYRDAFNMGFEMATKRYFFDDFSLIHLDALNQILDFIQSGDSDALSKVVKKYEISLADHINDEDNAKRFVSLCTDEESKKEAINILKAKDLLK